MHFTRSPHRRRRPGVAAPRLCGTLSALISLAALCSATPVGGGPGSALWFDAQRADVLGIDWRNESLNALTVEFWISIVDVHTATQSVVSLSEYSVAEDPPWDNPDGLQVRFRDSRTCFYRAACSQCRSAQCRILASSQWAHFAFTWTSLTPVNNTRMYRDGTLVFTASEAGRFRVPLTTAGCFMLGHEPDEYCGKVDETQAFDGLIDEFRVWDYARTPAEIAATWNRSVPADSPGLNIYYSFDTPGTTVEDLSGRGNNGLVGRLPQRRQVLFYATDRGAVAPTAPVFVASGAPMAGRAPVRAWTVPGQAVNITLSVENTDAGAETLVRFTQLPVNGSLVLAATGAAPGLGVNVSAAHARVLTYTPGPNFTGSDAFAYEAVDSGAAVPYTATVSAATVSAPADKSFRFMEDLRGVAPLGAINGDGAQLQVVITGLPHRGRLFQAGFGAANPGLYSDIPLNVSQLVQITAAGTVLTDPRGIVIFIGELDDYSASGPYTNFTFAFRHPRFPALQSASATVRVYVAPVNDPPAPESADADATGDGPLIFTLNATDVDGSFSGHRLYRITRFPKMGTLYQVGDNGAVLWDRPIVPKVAPPTVLAWASAVIAASSQFSRCDDCVNYTLCPVCPNGVSDYHASQILGPPDFFPASGDSPLAWSFSQQDAPGEFITLRFPQPIFVDAFELYEVQAPGSTVLVRAARGTFAGNATEWFTLWSGARQDIPDVARIFTPPVCAYGFATDTVRFDFDSVGGVGWNEFDAVKLVGTLDIPVGRLESATGRVAYVPRPGVFRNNQSSADAFDSFSFRAHDCENEGRADGIIRVFRPVSAAAESAAAAVFATLNFTLDAAANAAPQTVHVDASPFAADLAGRGVNVSAGDLANFTLRLLSASVAGGAVAPGSLALRQVGTGAAIALPFTVPPAHNASFTLAAVRGQGATLMEAEATLAAYSFRLRLSFTLRCPALQYALATTGQCVPCGDIPDAQIADFTGAERLRFEATCVEHVSIDEGLSLALRLAAGLGAALTLACLGALFALRNHPLIRYSSPLFLAVIGLGGLAAFAAVFPLAHPESPGACQSLPWLLTLGFACLFAPLFAKTYRLAMVFRNEKLRRVTIRDSELFLRLGVAALIVVAYLVAWTVADPADSLRAVANRQEFDRCSLGAANWVAFPLVMGALLLAWGVYLAYRVRNNPAGFNESRYIAFAVYNLVLVLVFVAPLLWALPANPDTTFLLLGLALLLCATGVVALLFAPKFHAIYFNLEGEWATQTSQKTGSDSREPAPRSLAEGGERSPRPDDTATASDERASLPVSDSLQDLAHKIDVRDETGRRKRATPIATADLRAALEASRREREASGGGADPQPASAAAAPDSPAEAPRDAHPQQA